MPFGKANSSTILCHWTTAWCVSFTNRIQEKIILPIILKSYVDDFFGGPVKSNKGQIFDKLNAKLMFYQHIGDGELTSARMNFKKCCPPARKMEILGFMYDSITRSCRLSDKKRTKYINRIYRVLESAYLPPKTIEKQESNLTYAAFVSPFAPFFDRTIE